MTFRTRKTFPEPLRINGLRYWRESELAQREREGMSARKTDAA